MCSSTRITLTWSRFFVVQRMTFPNGSTSLSSSTHDSPREIMPFGAHRGNEPVLRMRRVVSNEPCGVTSREMTSHERICDACGLGYRRRYARDTMNQGSLLGTRTVRAGARGIDEAKKEDEPTHSYKKV